MTRTETDLQAGVDLFWLPLGAGGHSVRLNGRVYEALAARLGRRPTCDLYHSALIVFVPEARFVIEQAPVRDANGAEREGSSLREQSEHVGLATSAFFVTKFAVGMAALFQTSARRSRAPSV